MTVPWYRQQQRWIVLTLVVFFPVGLFLMWHFAEWSQRTKRIVTCLCVWPMAAWWLWQDRRSRWLIGAASVAGLAWVGLVLSVFAGGGGSDLPATTDGTATATVAPTSQPSATPTLEPVPSSTVDAMPVATDAPTTSAPATATLGPVATTVAPPRSSPTVAPPAPSATSGSLVAVVSVTDGDTLNVRISGAVEAVRLIGINTPEQGECFAAKATARLQQLVAGGELSLVADRSDRDQYGRLLRYVYVGATFANDVMVREGYALAVRYEPDTAMASQLEAAQSAAENAGRGLWAPDACGTAAPGSIDVALIHYDAAGDDNQNKNDEWVDLRDTGGGVLDLTGWSVKDESASHRYYFPSGFTLAPGATVRLHTGCGTNTDSALFWCFGQSAIWNNGGDTVFVIDPSGNIVISRPY